MDKSRIIILATGVVALIAFSLYTFGSFSTTPKASTKVEPVKNLISSTTSTFENHDKPENYYSIQFPSEAKVEHGDRPGSYTAIFRQGISTVELVDIPDNSNIQLYILTQDESTLKSSLQNYSRVSFNEFKVGGNRAWDLTYTWKNATLVMESMKTFVEGPDNAAVITFSGPSREFGQSNSTINSVLESFRWIRQ